LIDLPVDLVKELSVDMQKRASWDPTVASVSVLEDFGDGGQIHYLVINPVPLISTRDFLYYSKIKKIENGWITASTSIKAHPKCPTKKTTGLVRGKLVISGTTFSPRILEDGSEGTIMTYVNVTDPKGMIPKAAVNLAVEKGAATVGFLRDHVYAKHRPNGAKN